MQRGDFKQAQDARPLFHYLRLPVLTDESSPSLTRQIIPFVLTYTEDTFKIRKSKGSFASDDVSRRRYNSMAWEPAKHLQDIVEVTLVLTPTLARAYAALLRDLGLQEQERFEKASYVFVGQDFKIRLRTSEKQDASSFVLQMRLTHTVPEKNVHAFDGGELVLEGNSAQLAFM
jgi:hypothetical protein